MPGQRLAPHQLAIIGGTVLAAAAFAVPFLTDHYDTFEAVGNSIVFDPLFNIPVLPTLGFLASPAGIGGLVAIAYGFFLHPARRRQRIQADVDVTI